MAKFKISIIFFLLIAATDIFSKDVNWEDKLAGIELLYLKGDYKLALSNLKRMEPQIEVRFGENGLFRARVFAYYAKLNSALGKFDEYTTNIDRAAKIAATADQSKINDYIRLINDIAEGYISYADYVKAEETIAKAKKLCDEGKVTNKDLVNSVNFLYVKNKSYQGYLNKCTDEFPGYIKAAEARIVKKEPVMDPKKGKEKLVSVPSEELKRRKRLYVQLINAQAKNFYDNGEYASALTALNGNIEWMLKNKLSSEGSMADAYYLKSLTLIELDKDEDARHFLVKAGMSAAKGYKPQAEQSIRIQEALIVHLKEIHKDNEAIAKNRELDGKVRAYYGKNSLSFERNNLLDIHKYMQNQDWDRAEKKLNELISSSKFMPADHIWRINALVLQYDLYVATDKFDNAEIALNEIVKIKKIKHGDKAPSYHMALLNLANHYMSYSDKLKEAEEIYKISLDKIVKVEIGHKQNSYLEYLYQESKLYELTDRFDKAFSIVKEASSEAEKNFGITSPQYAKSLDKYAAIDIAVGKYRDAEKLINDAIKIFNDKNEAKSRLDYAHTLETKAKLQILLGLFDEADVTLNKAYKLTKRAQGGNVKLSDAIEEMAILNIYFGKYQETEKYLNELIKSREEKFGKKHRSLINPLNQMGYLKLTSGNYNEAEKYINKAASLSKDLFGEKSVKYSESLKLLENLYSAEGDYEKAELTGQKVVDILMAQHGRNHITVGNSLNDLALVKLYNKKNRTEIENDFNESLKIISDNLGENNPMYAEALENMAIFYLETNKLDKANELIERANTIWVSKLGEQNHHTAKIYFIKGNISYYKSKYSEANTFFLKSKDIYGTLFDANHPDYLFSVGKSAQMYYILGDAKNAVLSSEETVQKSLIYIDKIFPTLSERGKAKYWEKIENGFEFYKTLAFTQNKNYPDMIGNVYNITLRTKAILLNASIKVKERILKSGDTTLVSNYQNWLTKKEDLTSAISMSAVQRKESNTDIPKIESEIEELEKKISVSSELFAQNYEKVAKYDWRELKKILKENDVAIELVPFRYFDKKFTDTIWYAAMAVSNDSKNNPDFILMKNGKEMDSKNIKYFRNCIKFDVDDEISYDVFWKPIRSLVKKEGGTIYLSVDGVYNQLNVEAIRTPDGDYVINKSKITLVSNTRDIIDRMILREKRNSKKKQDKTIVARTVKLFGNPTYYPNASNGSSNSVSQLPGAETEVKSLNTLLNSSKWNSEIFLTHDATEDRIKKLASPNVFHIATHGFFLADVNDSELDEISDKAVQNPLLRSGLLLRNGGKLLESDNVYEFNKEDGILTAYEAMNLNLDSTELVVLSACETGLGEVKLGEGVFGLQRSFLVAGSGSVIMSLFKVSDEITTELMSAFYTKWINTGDKRQAFVDAKKDIMAKYKSPKYWGAFLMVGAE